MAPTITLYRLGRGKLHAARPDIRPGYTPGSRDWYSRCRSLRRWQPAPEPVAIDPSTVTADNVCSSCGPYPMTVVDLLETPLRSTPTRWFAVYYKDQAPWPVELLAGRLPGSVLGTDIGLLAGTHGVQGALKRAPKHSGRRSEQWNDTPLPGTVPVPDDVDDRRQLAATVVALAQDDLRRDLETAFQIATRI